MSAYVHPLQLCMFVILYGYFIQGKAYTIVSLGWLFCVSALDHTKLIQTDIVDFLYAVLFCNSIAINISFHVGCLANHNAFTMYVREKFYGIGHFIVLDLVYHILPSYLLWVKTRTIVSTPKQMAGLFSLTHNLIWGIVQRNGFDLSSIYTSMDHDIWSMAWNVAIMAHIGAAYLL